MVTKYIKVPAIILGPEKYYGDEVVFTRESLRRHTNFEDEINTHLLINQHVVDIASFLGRGIDHSAKTLSVFPKGTVRAADWMNWIRKDRDFPFDKVKSIIPVRVQIEDEDDPEDYGEPERWTRELKNFLYIKVECEGELTKEETEKLFKYVAGQISDGWGENASATSFTCCVDNEHDENEWTIRNFSVYYNGYPEDFKLVDELGPRAYL